jgi:hypothetical protein
MDGKIFVHAAQASNEVIFKGSDSSFRGVTAMYTRWSELEIDFFLA